MTKKSSISREQALELLRRYNKEPFHIQHALTVEGVMRWYAREMGYGEEEEFWGITGLLHDIDFELFPEEHCKKAPELLREAGVSEDMIYAVCSHGYGICSEEEPRLEMEKVLFAVDELTGLIWSCALMRPSRSTMDMEVKSLKKNSKTNGLRQAVQGTLSLRERSGLAGNWTISLTEPYRPCEAVRRLWRKRWIDRIRVIVPTKVQRGLVSGALECKVVLE